MNSNPEFDSITPFFDVKDIQAALDFYCTALGFDLDWKWGEPPTHANVCRGRISISLARKPSVESLGNVYIHLSRVDAYFAELQARGVKTGPLTDSDYGMRDFAVVDPWGNRLVFGQPLGKG